MRASLKPLPAGLALVLTALLGACEQPPKIAPAPGALPRSQPVGENTRINAATYLAHGHLLERQGNFEQAIAQYRRALEARPDFIAARNRLAITLNKLGRHAEATREFEQIVARQPSAAYPRNNLGFSLFLEGRYAEAERILAEVVQLKPEFQRARMNHALALAKLGRFQEALDEFQKVCSPADAYFNIGLLLTEAGRYADAAQYLQGALELRPDFEAARTQLREVARLAAVTPAPVATPASATQLVPEAITDAAALTSAEQSTALVGSTPPGAAEPDGPASRTPPAVPAPTGAPQPDTPAPSAAPESKDRVAELGELPEWTEPATTADAAAQTAGDVSATLTGPPDDVAILTPTPVTGASPVPACPQASPAALTAAVAPAHIETWLTAALRCVPPAWSEIRAMFLAQVRAQKQPDGGNEQATVRNR